MRARGTIHIKVHHLNPQPISRLLTSNCKSVVLEISQEGTEDRSKALPNYTSVILLRVLISIYVNRNDSHPITKQDWSSGLTCYSC